MTDIIVSPTVKSDIIVSKADACNVVVDDYKVIGVWGTIGGNIENQTDLMLKFAEIEEGQAEAIPIDYINNLE